MAISSRTVRVGATTVKLGLRGAGLEFGTDINSCSFKGLG